METPKLPLVSRQKFDALAMELAQAQEQILSLADTNAIAQQNETLNAQLQAVQAQADQAEDYNLQLQQTTQLLAEAVQIQETLTQQIQSLSDQLSQAQALATSSQEALQQANTTHSEFIEQINQIHPSVQEAENKTEAIQSLFDLHASGHPAIFPRSTPINAADKNGGANMPVLLALPHMQEEA